jgi:hypothetical protein
MLREKERQAQFWMFGPFTLIKPELGMPFPVSETFIGGRLFNNNVETTLKIPQKKRTLTLVQFSITKKC